MVLRVECRFALARSNRGHTTRVYLSNIERTTFVVKAGRDFELLATNSLGERMTAHLQSPPTNCFTEQTRMSIRIAENASRMMGSSSQPSH